jgi:hypothetical protein
MTAPRLLKTSALGAALIGGLMLQGCAAVGVANAAVGITGAAVGATAKVATTAVGVGAGAVGAAGKAAIGGGH